MAGEAYLPLGSSTVVPGIDATALWLAPGQVLDDGVLGDTGERVRRTPSTVTSGASRR